MTIISVFVVCDDHRTRGYSTERRMEGWKEGIIKNSNQLLNWENIRYRNIIINVYQNLFILKKSFFASLEFYFSEYTHGRKIIEITAAQWCLKCCLQFAFICISSLLNNLGIFIFDLRTGDAAIYCNRVCVAYAANSKMHDW